MSTSPPSQRAVYQRAVERAFRLVEAYGRSVADLAAELTAAAPSWQVVPLGAWCPDRAAGFPAGFEVAAPLGRAFGPQWRTPSGARPASVGAQWFAAGLIAQQRADNARLRTDANDTPHGSFWERVAVAACLDRADTTPVPPPWLYAESFSPLVVMARHHFEMEARDRLVSLPSAPARVELVGGLVIPVWLLGADRPLADASGRMWPASLLA